MDSRLREEHPRSVKVLKINRFHLMVHLLLRSSTLKASSVKKLFYFLYYVVVEMYVKCVCSSMCSSGSGGLIGDVMYAIKTFLL